MSFKALGKGVAGHQPEVELGRGTKLQARGNFRRWWQGSDNNSKGGGGMRESRIGFDLGSEYEFRD